MNSKRYARQTILSEIGVEGQLRLSKSRILCVGVGGLGSPASLYLAAAGVGTIGLIDPDRVDPSNLQRQVLFHDADQGCEKVLAAQAHLSELNPEIRIEIFNEAFTAHNATSILSNYDLVIDGSDNFETKFLVNDACYKAGIPLVYGAANRFEGQVALLHGVNGACYRCLYPTPPKAQVRNCAESGVLGSVVGTIGTLQATLALQYVISCGDTRHPLFPNLGELTLFDLMGKWNIRSLQIPKDPKCPTCSRSPSEIELQFSPQICLNIQTIDFATLTPLLDSKIGSDKSQILLLDVRDEEEWIDGHISGATHWSLTQMERGEFPCISSPHKTIVTYCRSGQRSRRAAQLLIDAGFISVQSLSGGVDSWPEKLVQ